jgi:ribosomal protein L40E
VSKIKRTLLSSLLISALLILLIVQIVQAYDNVEYGFSITPPSLWSLIEDTGTPTVVVGFGKTDSTASINVAVSENPVTLSEIIDDIKDYLSDYFTDFNLVYETQRSIGGLDCYELEYTITQFGLRVRTKQVVFVEKGKEYVITYQALDSEYSDYLSDAENSITSFRLLGDSLDDDSFGNILLIGGLIISLIIVAAVLGIFFLRKRQKPGEDINSVQDLPQVKFDEIEVRASPKFCRYCGTANNADATFCEKCGVFKSKSLGLANHCVL